MVDQRFFFLILSVVFVYRQESFWSCSITVIVDRIKKKIQRNASQKLIYKKVQEQNIHYKLQQWEKKQTT